MIPPFVIQMLVAVALNIAAYLLMPRPKVAQPASTQQQENPVAEAGKPLPVVFGSLRVTELNVIWFGDKEIVMKAMKQEGGKK